MCSAAALYIKGLIDKKVLSSDEEVSVGGFNRVDIRSDVDSAVVGRVARQHMCDTIKNGVCNFDDSFFNHVNIVWGYDV
jgi:hypothetical protein